jgi:uncharacterized protein YxeA
MSARKKILIIIIIVVVLLLIGSGIWYWQKAKTSTGTVTKSQANVSAPEFHVFIKPAEKKYDLDRDGISNEEEKKLGLNPQASDTDGDGLNDYLEINKWKTDPKNPDTDGDSYSDGREVSEGYNPLGPGKLTK